MSQSEDEKRREEQASQPALKTTAQTVDPMQAEIDANYQAGIDAVNKQAEAYRQEQVHLYDIAKGFKDELEEERKQDSKLRGQENLRSVFSATGELVASLANLNQVVKGAPAMEVPTYSQDWMREVDKRRKDRKVAIDNIRDRQREAESKLTALKAEQDVKLASARLAVEQDRAKRQMDYEEYKAQQAQQAQARADQLAQQEWQRQYQERQAETEAQQSRKTNQYREKEQNRLATQAGLQWDEKTNSYKYVGKPDGEEGAQPNYVNIRNQVEEKSYNIKPDFFDNSAQMASILGYAGLTDINIDYTSSSSKQELQNMIGHEIARNNREVIDAMIAEGYIIEPGNTSKAEPESDKVDFSDFD